MNLINQIEIGYFRSIYKVDLKSLNEMNILFGRNDSGKSNFLRALNLFFNGETNPGIPFDFQNDLCHARLAESQAKADARRFVYVKIHFKTPSSWKASLGNDFYVKKTWSITTGEIANFETSIKEKKYQIYLSRFLNLIKFRYIPAIKDRSIFSQLLAEVYAVLSVDEKFNDSLSTFAEELKTRTAELSSSIFSELSIKSNIAPPSDLTSLFKALDFDTMNSCGDKYSLTLQHGDGIQVRHIPAILSFLSNHGKYQFNIWGFEEPENSLELAAAFDEASSLTKYSQHSNIQLFVTSHSPAFYSLEKKNISKFIATKVPHGDTDRSVTQWEPILDKESIASILGENSLLEQIASVFSNHRQIIDSARALNEKIKEQSTPVLFVEGDSDAIIITAAANLYYKNRVPFRIISSNGTTKMKALSADGSVFSALTDRSIFVLVDNDKEGRDLYQNSRLKDGGIWVQHNSNKCHFCRLPFSKELSDLFTNLSIDKAFWPCTIENRFPIEVRAAAKKSKSYQLAECIYDELRIDGGVYRKISPAIPLNPHFNFTAYVYPIKDSYKIKFANYIQTACKENASILKWTDSIFAGIDAILKP